MKKIIVSVVIAVIAVGIAVCSVKFLKPTAIAASNEDYLRVHIRANSNSDKDQAVKYKVKEEVVELLTPYIAEAATQKQAKLAISSHINQVIETANKVLAREGFTYTARAEIREEDFPTRSYGNTTLEAGRYEALIVELGSGTGDNWWCVMFPPLCFVGSESNGQNSIKYRSKIYEIIQKNCRKA